MSPPKRSQRKYDHRLVELVQETGDVERATRLGIPRSTAAGWLRRARKPVTTDADHDETLAEAARPRRPPRDARKRLKAVLRVLFVLFRILKPDLSRLRLPAPEKERLLRAVDRTRGVLGLRRVLALFGLSAARLHSWRVAAAACQLEDQPSCPLTSPQRLTPREIQTMRSMATDEDLRHVPDRTSRDPRPAHGQRLRVALYLVPPRPRARRRRPTTRVHPESPKLGIRATRRDEL
jgi:hypothetical protein